MTVGGEIAGQCLSGAWIKEDAFGVLPARLIGLLPQIGEDLVEVRGAELGLAVGAGFEGLGIELRVQDDCAAWAADAHVGLHAGQQAEGFEVDSGHLPVDGGSFDRPALGKLVLVKVESELFEESGQAFPNEVAEATVVAVFRRQPMLVDKLADMQQEGVYAVVAMELDAAEVARVEGEFLDWSQPAGQVMDVCAGVRV